MHITHKNDKIIYVPVSSDISASIENKGKCSVIRPKIVFEMFVIWLVDWLVGFMVCQPFLVYLMPKSVFFASLYLVSSYQLCFK